MIYAIAAVLVLIADQWLKYWVTVNIALDSGSITLIPGVLELVNIHNTGAAFGILQGGAWRWVFVVIALAFVVIAVYAIKRGLIKGAIGRWAVVGVLAGAIGNCIDRVINGYVVDMFFPVFLDGTPFDAIFNVADMFISCCGILFCLYIIFGKEYKSSGKDMEEEDEYDRPARGARAARRASGGSHARGGSHAKGGGAQKRTPAREARSEPVRRYEPEQQSAPERTRIPVQQPRPQPRPARAQQPRAVDPNDPFAEWEKPQKAQPRQAPASAGSAAPRQAAPQPRPNPQPRQAAEQVRKPEPPTKAPEAAGTPKKGEYEFTLEEILAEFSDK